jgi:hypothetical protein
VYDGQRQIELCCRENQSMNYDNGVSLKDIIEVDVVFEIQSEVVGISREKVVE